MTLTKIEEQIIKEKQDELGLTDEECNAVLVNLAEFYNFSDAQCELMDWLSEWISKRCEQNENAS